MVGPTLSGSCPYPGVYTQRWISPFSAGPGPQVRAMQRPPPGVKLVIEAVCILKGIKPKKVPGEKPGSKVDDYWEPGKGLLQDPGRFLEGLFKFDKVSTPPVSEGCPAGRESRERSLPHHSTRVSALCPSADTHSPAATELTGTRSQPGGALWLVKVTDITTHRWVLRKLGPGRSPVPTGCHPQLLQGSAAWRLLVPFPPCDPHGRGLDIRHLLDHCLCLSASAPEIKLLLFVFGFLSLSIWGSRCPRAYALLGAASRLGQPGAHS